MEEKILKLLQNAGIRSAVVGLIVLLILGQVFGFVTTMTTPKGDNESVVNILNKQTSLIAEMIVTQKAENGTLIETTAALKALAIQSQKQTEAMIEIASLLSALNNTAGKIRKDQITQDDLEMLKRIIRKPQ